MPDMKCPLSYSKPPEPYSYRDYRDEMINRAFHLPVGRQVVPLKRKYFKQMKSKVIFCFLFFCTFLTTKAQCAMCRAVLESEEGQSTAEGVNNGIMYLMSIPYLLVAGIGFIIYWKYFRTKKP